MGIEFDLAIRGNLAKALAADHLAGKKAAMATMKRKINQSKKTMRRGILAAGFKGKSLEKTIQANVFPTGGRKSIHPTGLIRTKFARGFHDLYGEFQSPREITGKSGWVYVATELVRRRGFSSRSTWRSLGPGDIPNTIMITPKSGKYRLVVDRYDPTRVYFYGVRRVRQRARIADPTPQLIRQWRNFGDLFGRAWDRETTKEFVKANILT